MTSTPLPVVSHVTDTWARNYERQQFQWTLALTFEGHQIEREFQDFFSRCCVERLPATANRMLVAFPSAQGHRHRLHTDLFCRVLDQAPKECPSPHLIKENTHGGFIILRLNEADSFLCLPHVGRGGGRDNKSYISRANCCCGRLVLKVRWCVV